MLKTTALILAASLSLAGAARADAIPAPMELSEAQTLLIGTWQETEWSSPRWGVGHSTSRSTISFANTDMAMLILSGVVPSQDYSTRVMKGAWTAERVDGKTLKVTFTQSEGRGTTLTLTFEGPDAFTLKDSESAAPATRFTRVGKQVEP